MHFAVQSRQARAALALGVAVAYVLAFPALEQAMGNVAFIFATLPVIVAAWLFELQGGLLASLLMVALNVLLVALFSMTDLNEWIPQGGGLGSVTLVLVGAAVGRLHDLGEQVKAERVKDTGLYEIAQTFSTMTDVRKTYGALTERMARLLGARRCIIALYDPQSGEMRAQEPGYGFSDDALHALGYPARAAAREVWDFRKQGPLRINAGGGFPIFREDITATLRLETMLAVPMRAAEARILGVVFAFDKPVGFSVEDGRLLEVFASQAGAVIRNARLFEAENRRNTELEMLRQASLHLSSTLELTSLLNVILENVLQIIAANDAHLFLYEGEHLTFGAAVWGDKTQSRPFYTALRPEGLTYTVARSGEKIVIPNVNEHPLFHEGAWGSASGAILGLPLRSSNRVHGVLTVAFMQPHNFTETELRIVELLSDHATIAIENARLYERAQQEIARREQAEQSLRLTQFSVDSASDAIYWIGPNAKFLYANNAVCRTLGYSQEQLLSMTVHEIHPNPTETVNWEAHWKELQQYGTLTFETEHIRKNGEIIPVEITANHVAFHGGEYNCVIVRDLTEKKLAEEELRKSQALYSQAEQFGITLV